VGKNLSTQLVIFHTQHLLNTLLLLLLLLLLVAGCAAKEDVQAPCHVAQQRIKLTCFKWSFMPLDTCTCTPWEPGSKHSSSNQLATSQ
jgi:hypothetical protein